MRFRLLGPLRIWDGADWVGVRAAQQRLVLTILLLQAGHTVSTERLIDEIWGESPPQAAVATVQGYVMRLRRLLGATTTLLTRGHGYELVIGDDDLDVVIFERTVQRGLANDRPEQAIFQLSEGLSLWRGGVASDVAASPTVATEATRLEQLRLSALEARAGARIELGRHADVVEELRQLTAEQPLRERLWEQLMLALYRCGRRAEALDAFQRARSHLVDELGIEPGQPLRELQSAILADDPKIATTEQKVTPAQLPPDVAGFTGRATHCARLDALLNPEAMVLATISGGAGVGKTALAVHWAHRVRERFPDGQLHVNLRGYATGPALTAMDVLARFLRALGVTPAEVPVEVDEAAALYRSLLAGRRVLVVLDNANHPDQIRPLLPSGGGCFVLVTSRDQLTGLVAVDGAVRVPLDVFTPAESQALLTRLLGPRDALAELAAVCAHLPLALRIAAANLGSHGSITAFTELSALAVEGDPQAAVRVAFDHSYATLPVAAQRLFRLVGLVPGPHFGVDGAAAMAGTTHAVATSLVDTLAGAHLVDRLASGRFGCHDLLRRYAAEQASAAERDATLDRLHEHYLKHADAAARLLYPHVLRLPVDNDITFSGADAASAWLDTEHPNLVAAALHAGSAPIAWRLADALRGYLYLRMHTVDWQRVATAAVAAADALGDRQARAAAHIGLATLHWAQGRHRAALDHFTDSLTLAQQAGWVEGESAALGNLGNLHWALGDLEAAADHYAKAEVLCQQHNQVASQATAVGNLGLVHFGQGRLNSAEEQCARALDLHRQVGNRPGEARTLTHLGDVHRALGRLDEALRLLTEALALSRAIGDRNIEGDTLRSLAAVRRDLGQLPEALDLAGAAVELACETGDRRIECGALSTCATVEFALGHLEPAREGHLRSLRLAREIGDTYLEVEALIGLAETGKDADTHARRALDIARQRGYRLLADSAATHRRHSASS